jgi:hypothetical protein
MQDQGFISITARLLLYLMLALILLGMLLGFSGFGVAHEQGQGRWLRAVTMALAGLSADRNSVSRGGFASTRRTVVGTSF